MLIQEHKKVFGWRKPRVKHVKTYFRKELVLHNGRIYALSNNRIEGWNSWFRRIYRGMRGFKILCICALKPAEFIPQHI